MFNIHDSPVPEQESSTQTKSDKKSNPTESTTTRGKRKRISTQQSSSATAPQPESRASSLDTGRQPPSLRRGSNVSAPTETNTSSLTAMSSNTIPLDSILSSSASATSSAAASGVIAAVPSDALGRQLTAIRRMFFTPSTECTQQTFLIAHESVVKLLADMRLAMYSASSTFLNQREESIRFVTAIGVVCRILALKLSWPTTVENEVLLSPIQNWAPKILKSWGGWLIQFIRNVTCWFDNTVSPNNVLRELSLARLSAPDVPLVALGGESILFESSTEMLDKFAQFVRSADPSLEEIQYWGIDVLRACILLLGDGINFAFIEGAFGPSIEEDEEEEEEEDDDEETAQTLLDAFEAAQPSGVYHDNGSSNDDDDDNDVDVEEEDDDETFMLRYGAEDEDDESVPFLFFPTRRSGLNYPERRAAENVPIVSHRKAYSGHCNIQTVSPPYPFPISISHLNFQIKDVNYYGLDDEYVMSGSDDGILFICIPTS